MEKHYVYIHVNENGIFYVGKGSGRRLTQTTYRNKHWQNTVAKYPHWGAIELLQNLSEERAYEVEQALIDLIGLSNLTNIHPGGVMFSGTPYDMSGENNPMWGKTHPNKGKKMPQNSHQKRMGQKHTKDSILQNKISQPTRKKVTWDGIEYCSIAECSRVTGANKVTIKRLNGIIDPSYIKKRKTKRKVATDRLKYSN